MNRNVGQVEELQFHLYKGKSFSFDVLWWLDAAKTQAAPITSVVGKLKTTSSTDSVDLIDLAPTFVGNRVVVRLTPAQTVGLAGSIGYLEIEASTATETKPLVRGRVKMYSETSE